MELTFITSPIGYVNLCFLQGNQVGLLWFILQLMLSGFSKKQLKIGSFFLISL